MEIQNFLSEGEKFFLPNLSVDTVIIGYEDKQLKCLLLQVGDKWLLPGGYLRRDQSVEEAAQAVLSDRAGLSDPHLQFLSVFGQSGRNFSEEWSRFFEKNQMVWDKNSWVNDRFVSLVYYSLVNIKVTQPKIGVFDKAYGWFPLNDLPEMWMDHQQMVLTAKKHLMQTVVDNPIIYNLLPEYFTMPDLHQLHQIILEKEVDRSRFQKKMLSLDIFERLAEQPKDKPGRNPFQYRIKK